MHQHIDRTQASGLVLVTVMSVRVVRMAVKYLGVSVCVTVGIVAAQGIIMVVAMVFVVRVPMLVFNRGVLMPVPMALGQVQPDAKRHQPRGAQKVDRHSIVHDENRNGSSDERRHGKVGAGPRRSDVAQRQHEKGQADSVTHKPDHGSSGNRAQAGHLCAAHKSDDKIE